MPRFQVSANNPFRTSGPDVYFETEIWECCRPWEVVLASYTWDNSLDAFRRDEYWVRNCGLCGEPPRPRIEDRLR